jgi:hypothetical protein
MYNAATTVVIRQQTKKKPLVTSLLVKRSYMWGWWLKLIMTDFPSPVKPPKLSPKISYRRIAVTCISGLQQPMFLSHGRATSSSLIDDDRFSLSAAVINLVKLGHNNLVE